MLQVTLLLYEQSHVCMDHTLAFFPHKMNVLNPDTMPLQYYILCQIIWTCRTDYATFWLEPQIWECLAKTYYYSTKLKTFNFWVKIWSKYIHDSNMTPSIFLNIIKITTSYFNRKVLEDTSLKHCCQNWFDSIRLIGLCQKLLLWLLIRAIQSPNTNRGHSWPCQFGKYCIFMLISHVVIAAPLHIYLCGCTT